MNELVLTLGIESWKPLISALVLPPVPLLLLVLFGARLISRRPLMAWLILVLGVVGLYLSTTQAAGELLTRGFLTPPPALSSSDIADLRHSQKAAIIVLGGGRRLIAPEYGVSTLKPRGAERLRYGIWLSRETGLPLGFSGGLGHGAPPGPTEAENAARIAQHEFARPLRWQEDSSRDTRENAFRTVAMLGPQGIQKIIVVTHAYHMRRALANFDRAAAGKNIRIVAAPMGQRTSARLVLVDWLPSTEGFEDTWIALHECLGNLLGA